MFLVVIHLVVIKRFYHGSIIGINILDGVEYIFKVINGLLHLHQVSFIPRYIGLCLLSVLHTLIYYVFDVPLDFDLGFLRPYFLLLLFFCSKDHFIVLIVHVKAVLLRMYPLGTVRIQNL